MAIVKSPKCNIGLQAPPFKLPDTELRPWTLRMSRGATGLLVAFFSNSGKYSQALWRAFIEDARLLQLMGIGIIAINPVLDDESGQESLAAMKSLAEHHQFNFPYLKDETQQTARAFGVTMTPDFLGFNANMELQYRGRLDASQEEHLAVDCPRELVDAMRQIAITGQGPEQQNPGRGHSLYYKSRLNITAKPTPGRHRA